LDNLRRAFVSFAFNSVQKVEFALHPANEKLTFSIPFGNFTNTPEIRFKYIIS
jgi:hypothetical protein